MLADKIPARWSCGNARRSRLFADAWPWFWYVQYHSRPDIVDNHVVQLCRSTRYLGRSEYATRAAHVWRRMAGHDRSASQPQ